MGPLNKVSRLSGTNVLSLFRWVILPTMGWKIMNETSTLGERDSDRKYFLIFPCPTTRKQWGVCATHGRCWSRGPFIFTRKEHPPSSRLKSIWGEAYKKKEEATNAHANVSKLLSFWVNFCREIVCVNVKSSKHFSDRKPNMAMENHTMNEDVFPIENGDFPKTRLRVRLVVFAVIFLLCHFCRSFFSSVAEKNNLRFETQRTHRGGRKGSDLSDDGWSTSAKSAGAWSPHIKLWSLSLAERSGEWTFALRSWSKWKQKDWDCN